MSADPAPKLRDRNRQMARAAIVDALVAVILRRGLHGFSMPEVADEAGVSLRTLYRYYPTREDLLGALSGEVDDFIRRAIGPLTPEATPVAALADSLAAAYLRLSEQGDMVRVWAMLTASPGFDDRGRRERGLLLRAVLDAHAPSLDDGQRRVVYGALRCLLGATPWRALTDDVGLSASEGAAATSWAISTLLAAVERGEGPTL